MVAQQHQAVTQSIIMAVDGKEHAHCKPVPVLYLIRTNIELAGSVTEGSIVRLLLLRRHHLVSLDISCSRNVTNVKNFKILKFKGPTCFQLKSNSKKDAFFQIFFSRSKCVAKSWLLETTAHVQATQWCPGQHCSFFPVVRGEKLLYPLKKPLFLMVLKTSMGVESICFQPL